MILRPEVVALIIIAFWLFVISVLFFRFYFLFSRIGKNSKKESLLVTIDEVLRLEKENKMAIEKLSGQYDTLIQDISFHIQKVGILRFNPFKDTGGDQSFILTLVDGHDTGVIISSYHTRAGTRWYAKTVKNGKGVEHELTAEEQKVLREAKIIH